jgi:S1-C subfamily serine protease
MRLCTPESALDNVWHILEVLEGSPAESAGLVPYGDWVLGWAGGVLASEGDFYEVVESHLDKPLRVYVYSYDFEYVHHCYASPD